MFRIDVTLALSLDPNDLLAKFGLEDGGRVQWALDNSVIKNCEGYVPASPNRTLEGSAPLYSQPGSGYVIWNTPYARYQYYGRVMTDALGRTWVGAGETKPIITDRRLQYDTAQNQLAGAFWFERMKADHMDDIIAEVRRVMMQQGE